MFVQLAVVELAPDPRQHFSFATELDQVAITYIRNDILKMADSAISPVAWFQSRHFSTDGPV
jgi:hypothetical protein